MQLEVDHQRKVGRREIALLSGIVVGPAITAKEALQVEVLPKLVLVERSGLVVKGWLGTDPLRTEAAGVCTTPIL